ncbi:MAG: nucleotidyltransferase domain-containing protein [Nanoarchaeota archaeon]
MELIKQITKAGNSSNVLLPKEWLGGTARVELIEKPIDIVEDIIRILRSYLKDILGIYIVGSYARKEETIKSDIDILVITKESNQRIRKGKYEIILVSRDNLDKAMKENIMPLLPMIKEAKTILNEGLINEYKNINPNKRNLRWIIEITKSSKKLNEQAIKISRELKENISDGIIYSIILGLRSTYAINCLKNNKIPTKKGLIDLLGKIVKTEEPYNAYLRSKNNKPDKKSISLEIAEKLNNAI